MTFSIISPYFYIVVKKDYTTTSKFCITKQKTTIWKRTFQHSTYRMQKSKKHSTLLQTPTIAFSSQEKLAQVRQPLSNASRKKSTKTSWYWHLLALQLSQSEDKRCIPSLAFLCMPLDRIPTLYFRTRTNAFSKKQIQSS